MGFIYITFGVSFIIYLGLTYGFFRVHLVFHVGFFFQDFLSDPDFFRVSLGFNQGLSAISFARQTGENKAK